MRRIDRIFLALCIAFLNLPGSLFCDEEQTAFLAEIVAADDGSTAGIYVKEVGGDVEVHASEELVFEPASTIKALHHVHAMRAIQDGEAAYGTLIPWCENSLNTGVPKDGCPFLPCGGMVQLEWALDRMMKNSDNRTTDAVLRFFDHSNVTDTAVTLGMSDSALNHTIGCGGPIPNQLTLQDIGSLYEEVALGYLDATHREKFFDLMLSSVNWVDDTIEEEGAALGLSATVINDFIDATRVATKGGSYDILFAFHRTFGGYASFPTASGVAKEYVFGAFINNATSESVAEGRLADVRPEMLREQIRDALNTFVPPEQENEEEETDESGSGQPFLWETDPMMVRETMNDDTVSRLPNPREVDTRFELPKKPEPQPEPRKLDDLRPVLPPGPRPDPAPLTQRVPRESGQMLQRSAAPSTPIFQRGDTNGDGWLDITDASVILEALYLGTKTIPCRKSADANDSGAVDHADAIYLLERLFVGGSQIPPPYGSCGVDPTEDNLTCVASNCSNVTLE